jgi:hypothetical protein
MIRVGCSYLGLLYDGFIVPKGLVCTLGFGERCLVGDFEFAIYFIDFLHGLELHFIHLLLLLGILGLKRLLLDHLLIHLVVGGRSYGRVMLFMSHFLVVDLLQWLAVNVESSQLLFHHQVHLDCLLIELGLFLLTCLCIPPYLLNIPHELICCQVIPSPKLRFHLSQVHALLSILALFVSTSCEVD